MNKEYIGDGIYAQVDGDALVLTTENGIQETNRIVIEIDQYDALQSYLKRYRELFA